MHSYGRRDSLPGQVPEAKARVSLKKGEEDGGVANLAYWRSQPFKCKPRATSFTAVFPCLQGGSLNIAVVPPPS